MTTALVSLLLLAAAVDLPAQTWTRLDGPGPSARRNAAAVYDPAGHQVLLFGGRGAGGDRNDLWALDLASDTWREITPATDGPTPRPRFTHNAVLDDGGRLLVWSGRILNADGSTLLNDVWAFDPPAQAWAELAATGAAPEARYGTAAVLDPRTGDLVTFAGFTTAGRFDDTWRFDPVSQGWREVTGAVRPGERCLHAAAYDGRRHRMLIFGGQRGSASLEDAWALDLAADTWTELAAAPGTGGRRFPAAAWDPAGDRLLVFGGERTDGTKGGDLWALDLQANRWSVLVEAATDGTGPAARDGAVLVHVPGAGRLILFGGTGEGNLDDTWSLALPRTTAVQEAPAGADRPTPTALAAWPNPFNAAVALRVSATTPATLRIHDALGRRVRQLDALRAGGRRVWDGRDDRGRAVASGLYFAVLETAGARRVTRLVLLR